ncbi:MAG: Sigma-54 dependent transcriptional regulator [Myxococcales bacterium]|nr:Sigma-54 dependent transcriptional regulator [Myxococcales bacterium]
MFLLLQRDRPLEPSARYRLGREVIALGRGTRGCVEHKARLEITVDDPWMSTAHAQIVREGKCWLLSDAGSRNGTLCNGVAATRTVLEDGDVIEVGRTFFLFRAALETPRDQRDLVDESELPQLGDVLRTISPTFAGALASLARLARSQISIVIVGESGTGKEVLSRTIHELSGRSGPFLAVNCAALPDSIVQSELFGHKKGAFSGALEDSPGLVRSADRGTLLLDELGDLGAAGQGALLRVLQEGEVLPIGGNRPVDVDVRVLSATHRDLASLAKAGSFRSDLLARLSGFVFRVPPLRERREDLGILIRALIRVHGSGASAISFGQDATRAILAYDWPLNVRELEKCITAAIAQSPDGSIQTSHLPEQVCAHRPPAVVRKAAGPMGPERDVQRRERLVRLLEETGGNISEIARVMGTARAQIHRWLRKYELDPATFRR